MVNESAPETDINLEGLGGGRYRLSGRLGFSNASHALTLVNRLVGNGAKVHMDLSELRQIDSAGLAVLLEYWRHCQQAGDRLVLESPPAQLQRLIRISDLEAILGAA
ncbi:STAS domain-containing protein [Natronospira bacteriovora]|uniref:STAS domain-containing protein n=1 Tax=Natronospira bacteriovora TaxID=3069753 RepID=A0ABU0W345_9GAMM|nr:STAS domain-containing protein [Natronospira sp. AB-CW4]MDQ2068434.1 STAS domain-containing protein [Natronospira sp. AB-CW4]